MNFDITALNAFRNANLSCADAIANYNVQTGKVTQKGTYGFFAHFRGSATQRLNNTARTQLLCALGNAFGIDGAVKKSNGKVSFSKDFMAKLGKLIGPELRAKDFKIAADGTVSSGKPLTQRRISAIINRAIVASRGTFDAATYRVKLDAVKANIEKLGPATQGYNKVKGYLEHIGKSIDFLENELPNILEVNLLFDEKVAQNNPDYDEPPYFFRKPGNYNFKPAKDRADFVNYIVNDSSIKGALFHFEQYKNLPREFKTLEDGKANINYVRNTTQLYVQSAIDLFLDANDAGKLKDLMKQIHDDGIGACMDDRASRPGDVWRKELGLFSAEELALDNNVAHHGSDTKLDDCLYEEIKVANNNMGGKAKGWQDVAAAVKKSLVGQVRPIVELNSKGILAPVMEGGKQVVRAITAEDIDKIGPTCADILGIFFEGVQ